ncbi:hypothetical protein D0869_16107 [Hortaea werneckii]|uniref:DUF1640 domain-containing protein n=1 Tax=Hortaea werneckii TaxID=91943 RepID=A0A3M6VXL8_HORWE|nr:DUF1640-domain-containing protein [Hortaea werneckii]KAI7590129.1 DUF1640-domain-containing protein [Hortaea werneckii]RMX70975.1 hypothetical protein D0869_16107 [Hortaea werneckii]RMX86505.1 hypothetical protein D0868_15143 [Hortaea werneckii]
MTTPFASNTIRSAHLCLSAANPIRPAYTSSITTKPHQPFHSRTTATTAFAQAQWNYRRHTPPRPSPLNHHRPNQQPTRQQPFTTTPPRQKDHHFDTLKFVQRLEAEGFTEAQSAAMMRVLSDVIEESIQNLTRTMVLREDQEKATYTQKVDFAKLRSELLSADSTESSLTRGTHERLTNDLAKLNSRLRDEVQRTQASVRLDLNLEKGRIREEANSQDLKIKETETRIEQECAALRERLEAVKFSTLQWLMGVCTGTAAIILGVWRLLM